jgi:signal transduction histidine kinase
MTNLSALAVSWPLAFSMAVVTAHGLRVVRRRSALNQALHELRRPLQAIALAADARSFSPDAVESSVQLAALALEELEREINGSAPSPGADGTIPMLPLAESAVARWALRARLGGGSLALRWKAGAAVVVGDQRGIAQALDNLIVNAIEHGGPAIVVEGQCHGNRLRVSVADPGRCARTRAAHAGRAGTIARLSGRRRRGHGLAVVRQVAAAHGGRFALSRSDSGSLAVLELPLATSREDLTA